MLVGNRSAARLTRNRRSTTSASVSDVDKERSARLSRLTVSASMLDYQSASAAVDAMKQSDNDPPETIAGDSATQDETQDDPVSSLGDTSRSRQFAGVETTRLNDNSGDTEP
eukprot:scaffold560521_cov39-Prasinocladus_malaysianus.AAC.1